MVQITTHRLCLRDFESNDVEAIHRIATTKGFHFYSLDGTKENAKEFVTKAIDMARKGDARTSFKMAVTHDGQCIGYASFDDLHAPKDDTPDIGYLIDPQFQRRGFACEAMGALMKYCYDSRPQLDVSWLTVHPENIASKKVAGRLGFERAVHGVVEKPYGPRLVYSTNRRRLRYHGLIS